MTNGIMFQGSYTYSVSKDTRSFDPTFSTVRTGTSQQASSTPFDLQNRFNNYAWSDFDRRHSFAGFYVVELPFGKGRKFGAGIPTALDWVIGGWQVSGTGSYASGKPFTVYSGLFTVSDLVSSPANCTGCSRNLGSIVEENGTNFFFDASERAQFSAPAPGEIGNTGRNFFVGPPRFETDISLSKKFKFGERYAFSVRVDAKNFTNSVSHSKPTQNVRSSVFGRSRDSVQIGARTIQLSGRFTF